MDDVVTNLTNEVAATVGVEQSALTLIDNLVVQVQNLSAAAAAGQSVEAQAAALAAQLASSREALAAAVSANTAAPAPVANTDPAPVANTDPAA